jgi:hypothetical protein
MKKTILVILLLCSSSFSINAFSHHSFAAQYDINSPITLVGTVTKVEWTNPHARFYINVTDQAGVVTNWNMELGSPNFLKRAGWSRNDLQVGAEITVDGSMARSGANMVNALSIILPDGEQIWGRNAADNR